MPLELIRATAGQVVPIPEVRQATGASAGRPFTGSLVIGNVSLSKDGAAFAAASGGTFADLGSGRSEYEPTATEADYTETLVVMIDAGTGTVNASTLCALKLGDYDGGIWIDSDASNINTVLGRDGTRQVPVSTVAAAKTLAAAAGFQKYYVFGSLSILLDSAHLGWTFIAKDAFPTIDLGNQNTNDSVFQGVQLKGTMNASSIDGDYDRCIIASVTGMQGGLFNKCLLQGTIALSNSAVAAFLNCYSGSGAAGVTFDVGNKDQVSINGHNGKVILASVTGATTRVDVSFNSGDELDIQATCTNGTVKPSGPVALTDNSGVGCTVDLSSTVLIADGSQAANVDKWQSLALQGVSMIENDTGQATYTVDSLKNAPSGGGSSPWSAGDVEQMRYRNQIDGTQTAPAVNAPAQFQVTAQVVGDKTGYSLSAAGVDLVWDEVMEGSTTARQSFRLSNSANAGKTNGSPTTTFNIRDLADTKNRVVATVDVNGNRTAVIRDVT